MKLKEKISPITKKLEDVNETTKNLGVVLIDSNSVNDKNQDILRVENDSEDDKIQSNKKALPNSNKVSTNIMETLGALMHAKNSITITQDDSFETSIIGTFNNPLADDTIQITVSIQI